MNITGKLTKTLPNLRSMTLKQNDQRKMQDKYIAIDDIYGDELWSDVNALVVNRVSLTDFDNLVNTGFIDLDGKILVDFDTNDN